jgi:hypothetical protein
MELNDAIQKIIFIGDNHMWTNEEQFLADNLDKLYEAGVRYLFLEGDFPEFAIPGHESYFFIMFYPWIDANWKYQNIILNMKINEINRTVPDQDAIKIITPEAGRDEVETWNILDPRNREFANYRDSYAAERIVKILKTSAENEKAIIFYGANHARNKIIKNYTLDGKYKYDRTPLAFLLTSYYGELFSSYRFFYSDRFFGDITVSESLWAKIVNKSVIVQPNNNKRLFYGIDDFDGYVLEPESRYGLYYQYVPTGENLRYIFNMVYEYEKSLLLNNPIDHNFNITDPQAQYLMGIYYLKLYF